jgi:hypothetical protein
MATDTAPAPAPTVSKALNIALWLAQIWLFISFGGGGAFKAFGPMDVLIEKMIWPGTMPAALVRFIGISELLGGIGMILPSALRIQPKLTPLAAIGLIVVMLLAAAFHVSRGEMGVLPVNFFLGGLAAFVAWGRMKKAPIAPR